MQHRWRAVGLGAAALTVAATSACTSFSTSHAQSAAASSSVAAAVSSAEHAKPGAYGTPADPSLPAPTKVATDPPAATTASAGSVSVLITYSGWNPTTKEVELGGYVTGVVESNGTCTATLTRGSRSVSATVDGEANHTTTSCGGGLSLHDSRLGSGTWSAVLSYRSPDATGTSTPVQVTIP